jgi:superfamily II DNA or RNA helicase
MDVEITDLNDVYIKVDCERSIAKELSDFFTFTVPNYQFTPAYKKRKWDGKIRLYNIHTRVIYKGLLDYVVSFCKDRNYTFDTTGVTSPGHAGELLVEDFIESLNLSVNNIRIEPHSHQIDAVSYSIKNGRSLLLSPTGSGKSLIIYILLRYYLSIIPKDKKILIVVPTTSLVSQLFSDFKDYSSMNDWSVDDNVHKIFSGQSKETNKQIVISTWQSLYKIDPRYFWDFEVAFGDECHLFKAKSLTGLMEKLTTAKYRFGTTGTLDGSKTHKLVVEGLFGRVFKTTTTKELIEKDLLSQLEIDCLIFSYNQQEIETIKRASYQDEIAWLIKNKRRNAFISDLSASLKGNTLVLFNFVEKHGIPLYDKLKDKKDDVYLIHGGTDVDQREEIRHVVDNNTNSTLVASYGTCSTGINIKNIHNIVFTSPSKSVIRVLQSIGRGLRKSNQKDKVKVYDIADNLCYKKWRNHTMRHLDERVKIYNNERFQYNIIRIREKQ